MTERDPLPAGGDNSTRAADGGRVPGACNTLAEFIRNLEDGQFDADCYQEVKELAANMTEHAWNNGGKAKGKLTITLDFIQEGGIVEIKSAFKVVAPVDRRPKSVMWMTEDNRFTRTRPGQQEMFGIRDVSGSAQTRSVD
ncbi:MULTISPECIES: hypothetical protein [unclassified Sphingobium]|uniref:hypothetical protein n=1 Tax=unclassified Sphingobium TaxID=2611147 RepID=UPI002224E55D|nr:MULTISPECIES: hypothetical protein [unclassified Sphingobium]MCW2395864.1 hypothetical protein [Sphingobium sp. B8D3B]MCW2419380.1 hypothetical protein [Sphingobium sp. B8D3C]